MDTPEGPRAATRTPSSRPTSQRSGRSSRSKRSQPSSRTTEETPLLAREYGSDEEDGTEQTPAAASLIRSLSGSSTSDTKAPLWKKRWPSILALFLLFAVVILIMLGFLATEGIEEYAMQAADFKPTKLALDSLTPNGVRVQVEGDFSMDASKVQRKSVRNFGRFGTWIASEVETGPTNVEVYLPEYGNAPLGKAKIPGLKVSVRNGHTTHISMVTDVEPSSFDNIRNLANDWLDGRLGQIRVKGKAEVPLKSGFIHLGTQAIEESLVFQGDDLPSLPRYNITKLNIREARDGHKGMGADASIMVTNEFPVDLLVPPVAVDVLLDGCLPSDEKIFVGIAETKQIHVEPKTDVNVTVLGRVEKLPEELTENCPDSVKSPLDALLGQYMKGLDATIYITCCQFPDPQTPDWARDLLKDITVPVPFAGRDMGDLIKNFSMEDVHFGLPDPFAEPGTPDAAPKVSAVIKVLIGLPDEMNFPLDVNEVKADADVFYKMKNLGRLKLKKWQHANSTRIEKHGSEGPSLLVEADIKKAPLEILDEDVFDEVVQALLFGGKPVTLEVKAAVSVGVDTPVGKFAVRDIPAEGVVPVKPIGSGKGDRGGKGGFSALSLKFGNLSIIDTTRTSITLQAHVNFTNPTNYSATVPYFNINILVNGTVLAQAIAEDVNVRPGNNTNILVKAVWDPTTKGGKEGKGIGKEFLSQYVSGYNTSLTLQAHNGTIPAIPAIGFMLSKFPVDFPTPRVGSSPKAPSGGDEDPENPDDPADDRDESPHFIRDAIMHIISSTAIFTLASPLSSTTLFITNLNATAFYEGHPSGKILYDAPFAVPPGLSDSPRLPVDWSLGSVGFDAIKKALGGTLQLSAYADVGIRIEHWRETIWFKGGSIGARIRP